MQVAQQRTLADVGREQNAPLDFTELVPRVSYAPYFLWAATFCCLMLSLYKSLSLRRWQ